jgi:uroporphyrinogen III methyltransferase/synthase
MSVAARGPLEGRTVVVTRAAAQASAFVELLEAAGAHVLAAPTIAIEPPPSWALLDAALSHLDRYAWVVFTSVNGVAMVDRRLRERGQAWSALAGHRLAAIGPATARALAAHGLRAEAVPAEFRAEALVGCLRGLVGADDRVLLPRADRTRDVLVTELSRLVREVDDVPAYSTRPVQADADRLRAALAGGGVDVVTFTSSSTARNFAELFSAEERRAWLAAVVVASIGPITAGTAAEYGLTTLVMPHEYTIPALARAIVDHFRPRASGRRAPDAPPGNDAGATAGTAARDSRRS